MDFLLGLGLALPLVSTVGIGTTTGVAQGVSQQRKANEEANNESRSLKFHLDVHADVPEESRVRSSRSKSRTRLSEVDGGIVVVRGDKLYIERKDPVSRLPANPAHHPFTGFFLSYPDEDRALTRGVVTTIAKDPPMLNWVYVDRATQELKYSNRSGSIAHHVGDYDWTDETEDSCLTFGGWESFVAVEEAAGAQEKDEERGRGSWAIYCDVEDDGLKAIKKGRRTLEVRLGRRVISDQEVNQWGIGRQGNIGFKTTREV